MHFCVGDDSFFQENNFEALEEAQSCAVFRQRTMDLVDFNANAVFRKSATPIDFSWISAHPDTICYHKAMHKPDIEEVLKTMQKEKQPSHAGIMCANLAMKREGELPQGK